MIFIIISVVLLWAIFKRISTSWNYSQTCLVGKMAIVTGSNTGIGFYTALDFAKRGARVILACRNREKAENAKSKIIEQTGNRNIVVRIVDFESLASVRVFAKEIKDTEEKLDILVNNAGALSAGNVKTIDGLNYIMQVNYFGPTLLTLLLIDLLKRSAPSRIVNVTSISSQVANLDPDDLNVWPTYKLEIINSFLNYANSKICNILFTNELARRLKGSAVVVNSVHPGTVNTEIYRKTPYVIKVIANKCMPVLFKNSEEGAQTSIYVSVSKEIENVSGEYFENCQIAWLPPMPKCCKDEGLARKVWEKTEEYIKLTPEERQNVTINKLK